MITETKEKILNKQSLSIKEKLAYLNFIKTFAAKNDVRQYLNNVIIEENRIYACNGHVVGVIENIDTEGLPNVVTVPSIINANKVNNIILLEAGNKDRYPNIDSLIPKTRSFKEGSMDPRYLGIIFNSLDKLQRTLGCADLSVTVEQIDPLDANIFTTSIQQDSNTFPIYITIVIMPMRKE